MANGKDSVVGQPAAGSDDEAIRRRAEQERQVQDEIQQPSEVLFRGRSAASAPSSARSTGDHIYTTIELVGSSKVSVDDAVQNAIARAARSLHNLRWFKLSEIRGHVHDGRVAHFQVTLDVGFTLDDTRTES